jgi:hypothetical protein
MEARTRRLKELLALDCEEAGFASLGEERAWRKTADDMINDTGLATRELGFAVMNTPLPPSPCACKCSK